MSKPGQCSVCDSKNVSYDGTKIVDESMGYEITCDDCGAEGIEWYNLIYSETSMKKRDSDVWNKDGCNYCGGNC